MSDNSRNKGRATNRDTYSSAGVSIGGLFAAEGNSGGHIVILCAEPDMGKTTVVTQTLSRVESRGGKTKYINLSDHVSGNAASRIVSVCRQMSHYVDGSRPVLVAFDDIPAFDENDLQRATRALRKLEVSGGNAILSIAPEAEGIADEFSDATIYRAGDLCLRGRRISAKASLSPAAFDKMTHGIPRLARAVLLSSDSAHDSVDSEPRYLSELCDVVDHSLRKTLMWEERWVRLAMVLLGRGSLKELDFVSGNVDRSLWESMARDAPVFGIDLNLETFTCVGLTSNDSLRTILPRLRPITGRSSAVTMRALDLLADREDFDRASVVALACGPRDRAAMVLDHAVEFINIGARNMVEDAISYAAEMGAMAHVQEARLALASLVGTKREYERLRMALDTASTSPAVSLLAELRDRLGSNASGISGATAHETCRCEHTAGMSHALAEALSALSLMREFHFADAYSYLMGAPERAGRPTVASCLLWYEYMLSMALSGNAPTADDVTGFDAALSFSKESGVPFLHQVLASMGCVLRILASDDDGASVAESCAQKAEPLGISLLQELFLLAAGIADLRADACARAFVRFRRVLELAQGSGDGYVQGTAHVLLCATKRILGDAMTTDDVLARRMPPRVATIGRALAAVIEGSDSARLDVMGRTRTNACPEGTAWIVHVLSSDLGDLSRRFKMVVPRPWLEEARLAAIVAGEFEEGEGSRHDNVEVMTAEDDAYRVDLRLLGGFRATVNGTPVSDARMERRRAKCLLTLLAVLPEHTARRYEIMETVWPDLDYHDARQRVYEATSVLRVELTTRLGVKGNPIVSSRGAGTLGLDPSCVHCDVDDFEKLARSLMSNSRLRPTDVVNGCARLERMYGGDVFVPLVDGAGLVAKRREELKNLYTDVMVYASQQALALGRAETAAHFAQIACTKEPLREDAELCLVKALGAAGRQIDAETSYHVFVERVAREARRPVSQSLRDAYHDLVTGSEDLASDEGQDDELRAASA